MTALSSARALGCQIWLEPDDTPERIEMLFGRARDAGLGLARLFLMWPWIEPTPDQWQFDLFDTAFDSAARNNIKIKATLTANSGPWHTGGPSVLHSFTGILDEAHRTRIDDYITRCVKRYSDHTALGQWISWNEPNGAFERSAAALSYWRAFLRTRYDGNIDALNANWRCGFTDFDTIPFYEDIAHPFHRGSHWNAYGPQLDDWRFRTAWLEEQLQWVSNRIRAVDPRTPICANPSQLAFNHAQYATNLGTMAKTVDVIGASYHPSWHFTFADAADFPSLVYTLTRHKWGYPNISQVEVTEIQTGNTVNSGNRPAGVEATDIAKFFLASLAAGASSVTGWCLNIRSKDFEAGDWGLLDDMDQPSERSAMMARLRACLDTSKQITGAWKPADAQMLIMTDVESQGIEFVDALSVPQVPGRRVDDHIRGSLLMARILQGRGLSTAVITPACLPKDGAGKTLFVSHLIGFPKALERQLLDFVDSGGTLVIDALSGRKSVDARIRRPWPGGQMQGRFGYRVKELQTKPAGYAVHSAGRPLANTVLVKQRLEFGAPGWSSLSDIRFGDDDTPVFYHRTIGAGRIVVCRSVLGPSLLQDPNAALIVERLLDALPLVSNETIRCVGCENTVVLPVATDRGTAWIVLAPTLQARGGKRLRLTGPTGLCQNFWTGAPVVVDDTGECWIDAVDGIAVLFRAATEGRT